MPEPREPPALKLEQTAGRWLLREPEEPAAWIRAAETVDAER